MGRYYTEPYLISAACIDMSPSVAVLPPCLESKNQYVWCNMHFSITFEVTPIFKMIYPVSCENRIISSIRPQNEHRLGLLKNRILVLFGSIISKKYQVLFSYRKMSNPISLSLECRPANLRVAVLAQPDSLRGAVLFKPCDKLQHALPRV